MWVGHPDEVQEGDESVPLDVKSGEVRRVEAEEAGAGVEVVGAEVEEPEAGRVQFAQHLQRSDAVVPEP